MPDTIPSITVVSFYLEVRADDSDDLHDKLYGYDHIEAEAVARGFGPREVSFEEMQNMEHVHRGEWERVQAKQETVNDLLEDAVLSGHPVLAKTDGTNLGSTNGDLTTVPHFGHSGACDHPAACEEDPEGPIFRLFPSADLVVAGDLPVNAVGTYELRDDVRIHASKVATAEPGTTDATRID